MLKDVPNTVSVLSKQSHLSSPFLLPTLHMASLYFVIRSCDLDLTNRMWTEVMSVSYKCGPYSALSFTLSLTPCL